MRVGSINCTRKVGYLLADVKHALERPNCKSEAIKIRRAVRSTFDVSSDMWCRFLLKYIRGLIVVGGKGVV